MTRRMAAALLALAVSAPGAAATGKEPPKTPPKPCPDKPTPPPVVVPPPAPPAPEPEALPTAAPVPPVPEVVPPAVVPPPPPVRIEPMPRVVLLPPTTIRTRFTPCRIYAHRPGNGVRPGRTPRLGQVRVKRDARGRWAGFHDRHRIVREGGRIVVVQFIPGGFCGATHPAVTG